MSYRTMKWEQLNEIQNKAKTQARIVHSMDECDKGFDSEHHYLMRLYEELEEAEHGYSLACEDDD